MSPIGGVSFTYGKGELGDMDKKAISPAKRMTGLLENALSALSKDDAANVIRAIPVAFPIIESSWLVELNISTPIGMVDRYLLDAIRRFGPIDSEGLSKLLGLSSACIKPAVDGLMSQGAPLLSDKEGQWLFTGTIEDKLEECCKKVRQEFSFLFNGITGEMLPIDFWKRHASERINPADPDGRKFSSLLQVVLFLQGAVLDCKPSRTEQGNDGDYGIPPGFIGTVDYIPLKEHGEVAIAFILISNSGSARILTVGKEPFELSFNEATLAAAQESNARPYCLKWDANWLLPSLLVGDCEFAIPDMQGVEYEQPRPGLFQVKLAEPEDWLSWKSLKQHTSSDDNIGWKLLNERNWAGSRGFAVVHYEAGDPVTARQLLLLRGVQRLKEMAKDLPTLQDVAAWWASWQEGRISKWKLKAISVDELLSMSAEYQDQEFQGYIAELGKARRIPMPTPSGKAQGKASFLCDNQGKDILNAVEAAKKEISILLPVIDDERILAALASARKRGVNIRIITAMRERQKATLHFQTRGFEGDRDPVNSIVMLRRFAELGIYCRDATFHPHAKLLLIDGSVAFISSANLTSNSLGWDTDAPSLEAGMKFAMSPIVKPCDALFDAIWRNCRYRQTRREAIDAEDEGTIDIHAEKGEEIPASLYRQTVNGFELLLSTCATSNSLANQLREWIYQAESSIILSALSIYDTQNTAIHRSLVEALKRGVDVRVCVRPGEEQRFPAKEWPDPSTRNLLYHGLKLYEIPHLHAKGILIDNRKCGLFSGNLNPFSLGTNCPTGHMEIGLFENRLAQLAPYANFLARLPVDNVMTHCKWVKMFSK